MLAIFAVVGSMHAQLPTLTNQPASRVVWAGCNVSFAVGAAGTGPFTYQWQFNRTNLSNNIITTVAGGRYGDSGDGGPATQAGLDQLLAVSLDSSGDLFLPDITHQCVRKVDTSGIITTVAGGGTNGLRDGGPATSASLDDPGAIAADALGNFFIPDLAHERVRKVDASGIISTFAGTGTYGYSGDGGPATNANLASPVGAATDSSGNLFIADDRNYRIRKVDTNGIIWTVAGSSTPGYAGDGGPATNASLYGPYRVAVDRLGDLFFVDAERIRKVDTNGIITTAAGNGSSAFSGDGGAATNACLNEPRGVAVDGWGNLFVADSGNLRIRRVDTNGIITTVAGGSAGDLPDDGVPATNASISPLGVAVDRAGNLFIADDNYFRVRKVTNTQGAVLALNEVTSTNAGNYQVVVTGAGGSVTSSVATLTVATVPLIYGAAINSDASVTLSCVSPPNSTNVVLSAVSLMPPVLWQPLSTNVARADGNWQYTDTSAVSWQARFYRSVMP
ncbi:RHS repeat-associated core domain protein (fragment) [Verrucomicrobia bacterium]